jgi:menaquinone-dependent protoporphyrinogen oxidase
MTAASPAILVAHASAGSEGQTALIAERLATTLRGAGAVVEVVDLEGGRAPRPFAAYDGLLLGGSVRGGRYRRSLRRLLSDRRDELARARWGFFSVCLTIASASDEARAAAEALPRRVLDGAGLRPAQVAVFGGALRFSRHGRLAGRLLFAINRRHLPETDTDHDWEYTDWAQVDAFARRFLDALRPTSPSRR